MDWATAAVGFVSGLAAGIGGPFVADWVTDTRRGRDDRRAEGCGIF